jgi:hypothetical protein
MARGESGYASVEEQPQLFLEPDVSRVPQTDTAKYIEQLCKNMELKSKCNENAVGVSMLHVMDPITACVKGVVVRLRKETGGESDWCINNGSE